MRTINVPDGGAIYGAPGFWAKPGRDGCLYVVGCMQRPGYADIGPAAFRIHADGRREWLSLEGPPRLAVRADVVEGPTGAEVAWLTKGDKSWTLVPLPHYVPAELSGELPPQTPVVPVQPAPTTPSGPAVDEEGRAYTTSVKKELKALIEGVSRRVYTLETKPVSAGGGVSRDEAWQLAPSAVFVDVQRPESGIRGQIESIARGVALSRYSAGLLRFGSAFS